jgi:hypothetical protein
MAQPDLHMLPVNAYHTCEHLDELLQAVDNRTCHCTEVEAQYEDACAEHRHAGATLVIHHKLELALQQDVVEVEQVVDVMALALTEAEQTCTDAANALTEDNFLTRALQQCRTHNHNTPLVCLPEEILTIIFLGLLRTPTNVCTYTSLCTCLRQMLCNTP